MGDFGGAQKAFESHLQSDSYLQSPECAVAEDFINAFAKHDARKLKKLQAGRGFNFLANDVANFARKLKMDADPEDVSSRAVPVASTTTTTATAAPVPARAITEKANLEEWAAPALPAANAPKATTQIQTETTTSTSTATDQPATVVEEAVPANDDDDDDSSSYDSDEAGIFA